MGISDNVAEYILDLLSKENGIAEIQRNELATTIGCVPSQINYVITSRFTPEQGYIVESRRGGGGYIRITRRRLSRNGTIMHIVNSIGSDLDTATARAILKNMVDTGIISREKAKIIAVIISEQVLMPASKSVRDKLRASLFKNILLVEEE